MRIPGIPYVQGRNSYRDADDRKFGIAIHATANTASDTNEAAYAARRTDGTSAHLYVDGDSVTQSLDTEAKAGHAGSGNGNENAYAIEITGLNAWTREQWIARVAWPRLGYCLAWLIRNDPDLAGFQVRRASVTEMRANPKIKALYGHNDMRLAWGGTDHTDPGGNFPWDVLINHINAALGGPAEGDDMYDDTDRQYDRYGQWRVYALAKGTAVLPDGPEKGQRVWLVDQVNALVAGQAASAQREQDMLAAIRALATAGGGSVDAAAIIARIDQRTTDVTGTIQALQAELDEHREQLAAERARLAKALAGE